MARHRVAPAPVPGFVVDEDTARAAKELEAWTTRKRKRSEGFTESQLRRAGDEVEAMLKSGDWDDAKPRHFLALYVKLHSRVYEVAPIMTSDERHKAVMQIGSFIKRHFDGDVVETAMFVRWTWKREHGKEEFCKAKGYQRSSRIGWRLQFGGSLLTDYLIDRKRSTRP